MYNVASYMYLQFIFSAQVKDKIFRNTKSGSETGTTQWSMNVTNMSNAKKGPVMGFNAYKEFSDVELDAQIVVSAMTYFQMKNIDGKWLIQ